MLFSYWWLVVGVIATISIFIGGSKLHDVAKADGLLEHRLVGGTISFFLVFVDLLWLVVGLVTSAYATKGAMTGAFVEPVGLLGTLGLIGFAGLLIAYISMQWQHGRNHLKRHTTIPKGLIKPR